MTIRRLLSSLRLFLVVLLVSVPVLARAENQSSLYDVPLSWTDSFGKPTQLSSFAGGNVVLTMAYATCRSTCPLTFKRLEKIEKELTTLGKSAQFVIVSLDTARDTPQALAHFRNAHGIKGANWHLLTGSEPDTRKLSVLLGVSYQKDPQSGEIMHSNKVFLLNSRGSITVTLDGLNAEEAPLVEGAEGGKS